MTYNHLPLANARVPAIFGQSLVFFFCFFCFQPRPPTDMTTTAIESTTIGTTPTSSRSEALTRLLTPGQLK